MAEQKVKRTIIKHVQTLMVFITITFHRIETGNMIPTEWECDFQIITDSPGSYCSHPEQSWGSLRCGIQMVRV